MKTFKISAIIAIAFFTIGSILFLIQMTTTDIRMLPVIGLYYVIAAAIINCIILLLLIGKLFIDKEYIENLKSMGVILANIPVALLYIYILFEYSFI